MKICWILFAAILLISIYGPSEAAGTKRSLQDFIENFIDSDKFQEQGLGSINSTAMKRIWNFFKAKFNRNYATNGEEKQRLGIFRDRLKSVIQSNLKPGLSYKLEMNHLSDLTTEEFLKFKTGYIPKPDDTDISSDSQSVRRHFRERFQNQHDLTESKRILHSRQSQNRRGLPDWFWNIFDIFDNDDDKDNTTIPAELDWRIQNVVTPVKDQGNCGSCWAFATSAVMESAYAIKTKSQDPISFSPQQLVSCATDGNYMCEGGMFDPSVEYLSGEGGNFATLDAYPYIGDNGTCRADQVSQINLGNIKSGDIRRGNEKKLAEALVKYGPMFIAMHVSVPEFMHYKSGVVTVPDCSGPLEHALTVVGYGYDNDLKMAYWIIKNSWGTSWGENGYVRLAKDAGNMCSVASAASWATLT